MMNHRAARLAFAARHAHLLEQRLGDGATVAGAHALEDRAQVAALLGLQAQRLAQLLRRDLTAPQQDLTELVTALAAAFPERRNLLFLDVLAGFLGQGFGQFGSRFLALRRQRGKGRRRLVTIVSDYAARTLRK